MISNKELIEAKEKLEAIGLIKTYVKQGNVNSYIYELYSPMSASEFINNPLLNIALFNAVGKLEYDRVVNFFRVPKINLKEYVDVTKKFSDIFDYSVIPISDNLIHDLKKSNHRKLEILSKIDLISDDLLNKKSITRDTR